MKVKADFDLCESNAICVGIAPDVFEVDDDDYLQILDDEVTDENRARVEQASMLTPPLSIAEFEAKDRREWDEWGRVIRQRNIVAR